MHRGLSIGILKWIATVCMLFGYIGLIFFETPSILGGTRIGDMWNFPLRAVGRFAFPLFLFCLTEGYFHTKDIKKYTFRLLIFAIISEIPYDFGISGQLFDLRQSNVLFTMFLIIVLYRLYDAVRYRGLRFMGSDTKWCAYGLIWSVCTLTAVLIHCDHGFEAIFAASILYVFHNRQQDGYHWALLSLVLFCGIEELFAIPTIFLINRYNYTKGSYPKYFFYLFYPLHLVLLRLVYHMIFRG